MRTEDGSIIYRCLNGEPEAFGLLVDKYKTGVYAFVYAKIHDFHYAQDVTQEVFLQAYRDLSTLRRWESFVFWLYRIASMRCKKWIRAGSRRPDREFIEDQSLAILEASSLASHRENQLIESLWESLDSLPEAYREVLLLHYFGGMTSKDIAGALGTSPMAILQRLSRARVLLKEEMVDIMSKAFKRRRLPVTFTFRVVAAVKRMKIKPMPQSRGLPWGLSLAAGIVVTAFCLNPHLSIPGDINVPASFPLPIEAQIPKVGEIPVDVLKITNMTAISAQQGNGKGGELKPPSLQNTLFMAPRVGDTWTKKADMPTARTALSIAAVNGKIYAIGGWENGKFLPVVEEYDPAKNRWAVKSDMPTARGYFSTAVLNGRIYAIGGSAGPGSALSKVEEYDPATDTWKERGDMPTARYALSISAMNGMIYAIGGADFINGKLSVVEEYDPTTDAWTKKGNMPTVINMFSTSAVNGKIYAVGGDIGPVRPEMVWEYDPAADKWTRKANMPTMRVALSTSVVNGRIYAIGGWSPLGEGIYLSVVEEYDPATDTWVKKADMPTARAFLGTVSLDGMIYAIGGDDGGGDVFSTVEEYDVGLVEVKAKGKLTIPWGKLKSE